MEIMIGAAQVPHPIRADFLIGVAEQLRTCGDCPDEGAVAHAVEDALHCYRTVR
jgi:hypothetical protein